MIAKFIKKTPTSVRGLFAALIVPFLLFPFYHFHPYSAHGHPGQLQLHVHQGHFHSEVMEGLAHLARFHPSNPNLDEPFHQSHSLPEHDSDDSEFYTHSTNAPPIKFDFASKQLVNFIFFKIPQPPIFYSSMFEVSVPEALNLFGSRSQRAPPLLI
ncbi:MAG: hypothetical protein ACE5G9_06705 [Nitrospinales bacterium]